MSWGVSARPPYRRSCHALRRSSEPAVPLMNSHQLNVFLAAARQGSFSRAAEALYLTQSAVSQHIDAVEREHGVRLFERLPRRVVLTDAGRALLPYAERVSALLDEAVAALDEVRGVLRGHLHLGASPTPATYVLPEVLGAFARRYPGVEVSLAVDPSTRVAERVAAGECALGIVGSRVDDHRVSAALLLDDRLVLIAPPTFAPSGPAVTAAELQGQRYIAREPGSLTRDFVDSRLRTLGIAAAPAMELGHIEAIKRAVAAGLGVAFLSARAVSDEVSSGRLSAWPVAGLDLAQPWYTVVRRDSRPSPAAAAFLAHLKDSVVES